MEDSDPDAGLAILSPSSGSRGGPQGAAYSIVLENHMEACYEGRRIVLIPECELRVLLRGCCARGRSSELRQLLSRHS